MKTNVFSDELPLSSMKLFKYAFILHLFFGSIMIFKSEISRTKKFEGQHFDNFDTKIDFIRNLYSTPMIVVYVYVFLISMLYIYQKYFDSPFVLLGKYWIERIKKVNRQLKENNQKAKLIFRRIST